MSTETKSRKGIGGPKTKEGKERIRLNALKLGLHANSLEGLQAVADAVGVSFDEVHQEMRDYHKPTDPMEETLVRRIARCAWKLLVVESIENHIFARLTLRSAPGSSLESLSVIERRTDVQLHRAIQALAHKRRTEQQNVKNKLPEAPVPSVDHARSEPESVSGIPAPERSDHPAVPDNRADHERIAAPDRRDPTARSPLRRDSGGTKEERSGGTDYDTQGFDAA